jgi:hypothetical protein
MSGKKEIEEILKEVGYDISKTDFHNKKFISKKLSNNNNLNK